MRDMTKRVLLAVFVGLALLASGPAWADPIPPHLQLLAADSVHGAETDIRTLPGGERAYAILRRASVYNLPWKTIVLPADTEGVLTSHVIEGINPGEFIRLEWDPEHAIYRTVVYDDGTGGGEPFAIVLTSGDLREMASVDGLPAGTKPFLAWDRDVAALDEWQLDDALKDLREAVAGDWIDQAGLRWTIDTEGLVPGRSRLEWAVTLTRYESDGTPQEWSGRVHLLDGIWADRWMSDVRVDTKEELPMEVRQQVVTNRWSRPIKVALNWPLHQVTGADVETLSGHRTGWNVTYSRSSLEVSGVHDEYQIPLVLRRPALRTCQGQEQVSDQSRKAVAGMLNEIGALLELNETQIVALNKAIWSNFDGLVVIYGAVGDEWTISSKVADAIHYAIRSWHICAGCEDARGPRADERRRVVLDATDMVSQRDDYQFLTRLNGLPVITRSAVIDYNARQFDEMRRAQEMEIDARVDKMRWHIRQVEQAIEAFKASNQDCTVATKLVDNFLEDLRADLVFYSEVQDARENAIYLLSQQLESFDRITHWKPDRRPALEPGITIGGAQDPLKWADVEDYVPPLQLDRTIADASDRAGVAKRQIREQLEAMDAHISDFNQAFSNAYSSGELCGTCGSVSKTVD